MKALSEKSKKNLKMMLSEKGFENIEVDDFGNVIQVKERSFLSRLLNKDKQTGKIITNVTILQSERMNLEYDPNEIVKDLVSKWIKEGV